MIAMLRILSICGDKIRIINSDDKVVYSLRKSFDTTFIRESVKTDSKQTNMEGVYYKNIPSFLQTKNYPPEYSISIPIFDEGLKFTSRFENGNLKKVFRISKVEYELYLSEDFNTAGHYNWFYFKTMSNLPARTVVTFKIVNMLKPSSLYSFGLKPFAHSIKENKGWVSAGDSISYRLSTASVSSYLANPGKKFYTLEWKYTYEHAEDDVYFAQFIPYTYSDLLGYLRGLNNDGILRIDAMCKTEAKNICPILTITENVGAYLSYSYEQDIASMSKSTRKAIYNRVDQLYSKGTKRPNTNFYSGLSNYKRKNKNEGMIEVTEPETTKTHELELALVKHKESHNEKRGVVIVGRVHPGIYFINTLGEAPGSWVMKGLIDFLLSDSQEAKMLRKHFIFRIVPMLNPDGVIYGNYRCSLLGYDLNRRWKLADRFLQPTVYYAKRVIRSMHEEREVAFFCDLHAHSMQKDIFMYGCSYNDSEYVTKNAGIQVIPLVISQLNKNFSYKFSRFQIEKYKESTARVVVFKEFGISNSYTCEASFFAYAFH